MALDRQWQVSNLLAPLILPWILDADYVYFVVKTSIFPKRSLPRTTLH